MQKDKITYFFENNGSAVVYATSDGTLFIQRQDAVAHSHTLEDQTVVTHNRPGTKQAKSEQEPVKVDEAGLQQNAQKIADDQIKAKAKKPSPAEAKSIKEKAVADYVEIFGKEPDTKLSAAKIQDLVDAKKAENA